MVLIVSCVLPVEKSDNANGKFGLASCLPEQQSSETENITCTVTRQKGDDGAVEVVWQVFQMDSTGKHPALSDFLENRGSVIFQPGDRLKVCYAP